jgi:hypothetical protein
MDRTTSERRTPQRIAGSSDVFTWEPIRPSIPSSSSLEEDVKDCPSPTQRTAQADTHERVIPQPKHSRPPGSSTDDNEKECIRGFLIFMTEMYVKPIFQPKHGCPPESSTDASRKESIEALLTFMADTYERTLGQPNYSCPPGSSTDASWKESIQAVRTSVTDAYVRAVLRPPKRGRPPGSGTYASEEELLQDVCPIIKDLRDKGWRPTQKRVARMLLGYRSVRQLQRWLDRFNLTWADVLERT